MLETNSRLGTEGVGDEPNAEPWRVLTGLSTDEGIKAFAAAFRQTLTARIKAAHQ
jgi:hypothetical protein